MCVCVCGVRACVHLYGPPQKPEKGAGFPRASTTGSCELAKVGAMRWTPAWDRPVNLWSPGSGHRPPTQQNGVEPDWRTCMHVHHMQHPCILTPIKQNIHISVTPSAPWGEAFPELNYRSPVLASHGCKKGQSRTVSTLLVFTPALQRARNGATAVLFIWRT